MSRPALIDKLCQAGKWLFKPELIPVDDVTVKRGSTAISVAIDALVRSGGGLAVDAKTGKLYVDFSLVPDDQMQAIVLAMVQQGGGLAVDGTGKLYVDFASMPTDKFESMLKSIRVPIWINSTKFFYVDQETGSDTIVDGIGETPAKPFKTIQACVNYVTSNYNVNMNSVGIRIFPGIYNEKIKLGDFSRTTGYITLLPYKENYSVTVACNNENVINGSGGLWYLRGMVLKSTANAVNDGIARFISTVSATDKANIHIEGCDINQEYIGDAPTDGSVYLRTLAVYGAAASIQIDATSKERNHIRFHKNNATSMQVLFAERGGSIQCVANNTSQDYNTIHCEGEATDFLYLSNSKFYNIGGSRYLALFVVDNGKSVVARRYCMIVSSTCSTGNKGPEFFPGDTVGTLEENSYCVYK